MKNCNPLVSVIIPFYNAETTIVKCLESVTNQSYSNLEIILINDGSTDNSLKIAGDFIKLHVRGKTTVINQVNKGVSGARNAGIKCAVGSYIAFLDSDDVWFGDKISKQIKILQEHEDIGLVATDHTGTPPRRFFFKKFSALTDIKLGNLLFKNFLQPSTVVLRREIIDSIGYFDETQRYAEEGNFFMRVSNRYRCVLMNETLIEYGDGKAGFGQSGLSSNIKEMEKGELKNLSFAYRSGYIAYPTYIIAVLFSLMKFFRRLLVVKFR